MSSCPPFDHLLVVPHLRVQNANAVSSPLTHGFPSITAFLGLMWALERKARIAGLDLAFNAVGVVCHDHQEQVTQGNFVKSFCLTRNPVNKDGATAAIVEEGRIHLELSLVFAVHSMRWLGDPATHVADLAVVTKLLAGMRVAGGSVLPSTHGWRPRHQAQVIACTGTPSDQQALFRKLRLRLLPGFALVARDDLLGTRLAELQEHTPEATGLHAWLSLSRINWRHVPDAAAGKGEWQHDRSGRGWIVPIPVGYGALGAVHKAGSVANARDANTPFRFVESLYSVGEWISPHRLQTPHHLLWYADSQPAADLYRCRNDYRPATTHHFD
ncbi:type I-F CRISPR-associated protein Csy2 [Xanthomonas albilineans]|uniref:Probable crispr-associated protein, csy2 family n=1 Tax=Xanthomonas albilineans (strain GPE PC73 / CFBP 7063) TaxID=380358 RepID=D2UGL7_XANAP|nr:type I-F CRISPR-associated protein Csy2 [Xanthomonas albilineans]QHQ29786.1 putative CRISPR-associated protein csy2 family [Xanthomonas albilineans]CBA17528.1 probable crispr-associated protein, csy2 family [Xanthomonas albilineans GPE PC73]